MQDKKCDYCENGYIKKHGIYVPCKKCITPARFEATLNKAIKGCDDFFKKKTLQAIRDFLPKYPIMALLEAEHYGGFSKDFVIMLTEAYEIRPFMDVKYKGIK